MHCQHAQGAKVSMGVRWLALPMWMSRVGLSTLAYLRALSSRAKSAWAAKSLHALVARCNNTLCCFSALWQESKASTAFACYLYPFFANDSTVNFANVNEPKLMILYIHRFLQIVVGVYTFCRCQWQSKMMQYFQLKINFSIRFFVLDPKKTFFVQTSGRIARQPGPVR